MNTKEMRAKSADELNKELLELRSAQFKLRMQAATQQLTKTSEIQRLKREIAKVKTVLNEKARAAQ
jgi:large subunit ribosomal protein L29